MGFWNGMKKMVEGKPLFEAQDSQTDTPQVQTPQQDDTSRTPVAANGQKIIPEVSVEHVDCHENGPNLEVWASIKNVSTAAVFLDKIYFLSQRQELDTELAPGAARQWRIYRGAKLTAKPAPYADIDYRLVSSGDYFRARFYVEYDYDSNGSYCPEEFSLQRPVRDI